MSYPPPPPPAPDRGADSFGWGGFLPVRWGFGDAAWAIAGGLVLSIVVGAVTVVLRYPDLPSGVTPDLDAVDSAIAAVAQFGGMAFLLWLTVGRRGRGLRRELGLVVRLADAGWLVVGALSTIVMGVLLLPINALWDDGNHGKQQIGEQVKSSASWARVALVIAVVVVAPVVEETLFRGVVLRSALRRVPAVAAVVISGASFALLHLLDVTTFPGLPALFFLGTFSAVVATRTGDLSRSIYLHAGFNLIGAISLLM